MAQLIVDGGLLLVNVLLLLLMVYIFIKIIKFIGNLLHKK